MKLSTRLKWAWLCLTGSLSEINGIIGGDTNPDIMQREDDEYTDAAPSGGLSNADTVTEVAEALAKAAGFKPPTKFPKNFYAFIVEGENIPFAGHSPVFEKFAEHGISMDETDTVVRFTNCRVFSYIHPEEGTFLVDSITMDSVILKNALTNEKASIGLKLIYTSRYNVKSGSEDGRTRFISIKARYLPLPGVTDLINHRVVPVPENFYTFGDSVTFFGFCERCDRDLRDNVPVSSVNALISSYEFTNYRNSIYIKGDDHYTIDTATLDSVILMNTDNPKDKIEIRLRFLRIDKSHLYIRYEHDSERISSISVGISQVLEAIGKSKSTIEKARSGVLINEFMKKK